ncbi:TetR/AcrR family transcriptional regulator [Nocardioides speluncae]|uniref:TetR/AcrR family transcriptional regulator n=1 Tax=Nocardioides speluncae TaxID=2670337 RepID=UPI001F0C9685|nr:TetR/AcrR family transcriptional regulator [Nocardioides speluncae]
MTQRDSYLDAARDCILDLGWRRTTLTEVARRAGVSRMTIYRTWADMPALLGDLLTRELGALMITLTDEPDPTAPWADRLADLVVNAIMALRANPLFRRILDLDAELLLPYLLERRGRTQEAMLGILVAQIAEAQAAGSARAGDPVLIARSLVLTTHGFTFSMPTMADDAITEEAMLGELRLLLARGLAP